MSGKSSSSNRRAEVTEPRQAEQALRDSEERFRDLADSMPQIVWTVAPGGTVTFVNQQWVRYTGLDLEQSNQPARVAQVLHPEDARRTLQQWTQWLATGEPREVQLRLRRRSDRSYRWFLARAVPCRDSQGRLREWFATATEIHAQKQAEDALREADRRKDEFLATLAHELRNPLSPMSSAVHLLQQPDIDAAAAARATAILERQLGHMVRLIDDLLDINRIRRNKLELRKERIELSAVIEAALETSRPLIEASQHELTVTLPDEPLHLDADLTRLEQVFSNLLTNAAKYTDRGGHIRLSARRQGNEVVVTVADTGIGIAPENLPRLFEMFAQFTPAMQRSQGGLGIGLTLVRGLVEMHGGRVTAHSDGIGKGSEFVVRLPLAGSPATERPEPHESQGHPGCRILVVDDLVDAAETLAMMLSLWGNAVRTAHDGPTALETAAAFQPDVILLDIGLPGFNGYEVARRIRAQPWGERMVIVAVTGWGQEEDRQQALEAGCDHHLTKPVDREALVALLAAVRADRDP